MRNILTIATSKDLMAAGTMTWDDTRFDALSYGFDVSSPEALNALETIGNFVELMKATAGSGETGVAEIIKN